MLCVWQNRTHCYIDDILVSGSIRTQHLECLEEVLKRLADEGVTVKHSKCRFLTNIVEYLAYVIDEKGLHSSDKKLEAIRNSPVPQNVQQLIFLLGLVYYYGKCLHNLASVLYPLLRLDNK